MGEKVRVNTDFQLANVAVSGVDLSYFSNLKLVDIEFAWLSNVPETGCMSQNGFETMVFCLCKLLLHYAKEQDKAKANLTL
jgi:hypothetical protein